MYIPSAAAWCLHISAAPRHLKPTVAPTQQSNTCHLLGLGVLSLSAKPAKSAPKHVVVGHLGRSGKFSVPESCLAQAQLLKLLSPACLLTMCYTSVTCSHGVGNMSTCSACDLRVADPGDDMHGMICNATGQPAAYSRKRGRPGGQSRPTGILCHCPQECPLTWPGAQSEAA